MWTNRLAVAQCVLVAQISLGGDPAIEITSPLAGQSLSGTVLVEGTASGVNAVRVSINGTFFGIADGVAQWNIVLEPGSVPPGQQLLVARGFTGSGVVSDSVAFTIEAGGSSEPYSHPSSVDGEPLTGSVFVPGSYSGQEPVALVCYMHGAGGRGVIPQSWVAELEARGVIMIAPDGRAWGLASPTLTNCDNPNAVGTCDWCYSPAYVDNPFEPLVGPGEQDILDSIDWAIDRYNIDPDRIYLSGFSYGGRGAYLIGLRNPDLFAAIAPLGPASDMYEVFERRTTNQSCREGIVSDGAGGGVPGDSAITDTLYTMTSPRFLLENAYNLPVFHAHGTNDTVTFNVLGTPNQYLHGYHMLFDTSWDAAHGGNPLLAFGHTPTLSELHGLHPAGYDWDYLFTPVGHTQDPAWVGPILDFLLSRTRTTDPETVVYKTYTPQHRSAYWLDLDTSQPWTDIPAAVRATRDAGANAVTAEVVRASDLTLDIDRAGLDPNRSLAIYLSQLNESVFDPAVEPDGPEQTRLHLVGPFEPCEQYRVSIDGTPRGFIIVAAGVLEIGVLTVSETATTVVITPGPDPDIITDGVLNIDDVLAFLDSFAAQAPAADITSPCGEYNIDDVLAYLDAFASG